jgi:hypothetical protein
MTLETLLRKSLSSKSNILDVCFISKKEGKKGEKKLIHEGATV